MAAELITREKLRQLPGLARLALERIKAGHAPMRIPADPSDPDLVLALVPEIVDELLRRREAAERDLRFMQAQIDEVGSLKRRITALRRSCKTRSSVGNVTAREVLREDDERRRRFEKSLRKAVRRG